ncbi:MAG: hypothetical protein WA970_23320 [Gammaproteobacteria bacterium]
MPELAISINDGDASLLILSNKGAFGLTHANHQPGSMRGFD